MEILALAFKNINSLKGEHRIDFEHEDFAQNPLFAITGPTGSGKTTLLDVISLALFCEVPRLGRISKSTIEKGGAILTRNQKEAYAEVSYVCAQGQFKSIWSISTNRNGKLRDYAMELSRLDPPKTLDLKKSEVPKQNEKLIGLNYDQFIKSVVLAQGEFAKFLKADKKSRSQLLEQITGTGIYRAIGVRAHQKNKAAKQAIEKEQNLLDAYKKEALSAEDIRHLETEQQKWGSELTKQTAVLDEHKRQLTLKKDAIALKEKIAERVEKHQQLTQEQQAFSKNYGKLLAQHEQLQEHVAELHDCDSLAQQSKQLSQKATQLEDEQKKHRATQKQLLHKIQELIGESVTKDVAEAKLEQFQERVEQLFEGKRKLETDYRENSQLFKRELEEVTTEIPLKTWLTDRDKWVVFTQRITDEKQATLRDYQAEIPIDFNTTIGEIEQRVECVRQAQRQAEQVLRLRKEYRKYDEQLTELGVELEPLPEKIDAQKQTVETRELNVKTLRQQQELNLLQAELKTLRHKLKTGEPCPLCGSIKHPYEADAPEANMSLEGQIKTAEKQLNDARRQLTNLEANQKSQLTQKAQWSAQQEERKNELRKAEADFKAVNDSRYDVETTDWELELRHQQGQIKQLKKLEAVCQRVEHLERAKPLFNAMLKITTKGKGLNESIKKLYAGKATDFTAVVRELERQWLDNQHQINAVKTQWQSRIKEAEQLNTQLDALKGQLLPVLIQLGFETVGSARKAVLSPEHYRNLKTKNNALAEKLTSLNSGIATLRERLNEQKTQLTTTANVSELHQRLTALEDAVKTVRKAHNSATYKLETQKELRQKITKVSQGIADQVAENRRWELLNRIIGDAKGEKFNQFAQDLTLRQLLSLTNQRLKGLSKRYRLDVTTNEKDDLEVQDLDMGGQQRSVKTLSGGETFLLSLSLALALSDLASKNVQINSLFIDEGFGTLDPETLDQTLDTLERLQASSAKTIGIISHVESLKERIGMQIQLRRDGSGYSALKMVSR